MTFHTCFIWLRYLEIWFQIFSKDLLSKVIYYKLKEKL